MSIVYWILAIVLTSLVTYALAKWRLFTKNFWKVLYTLLVVVGFIALMNLAWFCAEKAFNPRSTELKIIQSEKPALGSELMNVENYKATYDLFNSQFSQLLVLLGLFGTLFGIVIPAGAYLLQRQSLKDEREALLKDADKKICEMREKQKKIASYVKSFMKLFKLQKEILDKKDKFDKLNNLLTSYGNTEKHISNISSVLELKNESFAMYFDWNFVLLLQWINEGNSDKIESTITQMHKIIEDKEEPVLKHIRTPSDNLSILLDKECVKASETAVKNLNLIILKITASNEKDKGTAQANKLN